METNISQREHAEFRGMRYLIQYPAENSQSGKSPAILFLHGAGSRGTDFSKIENNLFFQLADLSEFLVFAPQCRENSWADRMQDLSAFAKEIAIRPDMDETRFYAMGYSMGGYATWQIAISNPDLFAAIVPICGGGMYWDAAQLEHTPVWAFHGAKDETVFPEESRKMVDAVNRFGGNAKLTVYPDCAHDSWSDTYRNPEVFQWLLSQRKDLNLGE